MDVLEWVPSVNNSCEACDRDNGYLAAGDGTRTARCTFKGQYAPQIHKGVPNRDDVTRPALFPCFTNCHAGLLESNTNPPAGATKFLPQTPDLVRVSSLIPPAHFPKSIPEGCRTPLTTTATKRTNPDCRVIVSNCEPDRRRGVIRDQNAKRTPVRKPYPMTCKDRGHSVHCRYCSDRLTFRNNGLA